MERRKFVIGAGALATGSAAAVGSGAFTSVEADRDISVEVTGDASAFLGLEPYPGSNGEYADGSGDTVSLDFTETSGADGSTGLNYNADTNIEDVLQVRNNGTQDVYVNVGIVDSSGNTGQDVAGLQEFGISGDSTDKGDDLDADFARLDAAYNGDALPVGEEAGLGFYFFLGDDGDTVLNDIETLVIVAAESEDELDDIAADF